MKKVLVFTLSAIAAAFVLCSAASAVITSGNESDGIVSFESSATPALNFTMPVSRAGDIFQLLPEPVTSVARQEYAAIRSKCRRASSFTHEGITVRRYGSDPSMSFVFSVPGYKVTVNGVSWDTLDRMFSD